MRVLNILTRSCLPLETFDAAVTFYENLIGQRARLRFEYPAHGLRLAQVANLLLIGGNTESLVAFTATNATYLVDDIQAYALYLPTLGVEVLRSVQAVPSGWNMLVRHPDGTIVEYVQHRDPHPADVIANVEYPRDFGSRFRA
jgi:predicted enzyme related to lactoylglutathione lyase